MSKQDEIKKLSAQLAKASDANRQAERDAAIKLKEDDEDLRIERLKEALAETKAAGQPKKTVNPFDVAPAAEAPAKNPKPSTKTDTEQKGAE